MLDNPKHPRIEQLSPDGLAVYQAYYNVVAVISRSENPSIISKLDVAKAVFEIADERPPRNTVGELDARWLMIEATRHLFQKLANKTRSNAAQ